MEMMMTATASSSEGGSSEDGSSAVSDSNCNIITNNYIP